MHDLRYAGTNVKKAAYQAGFRVGRHNSYFTPVTDNARGVKCVVGDDRGREEEITVFDMEYAAQFTWEEIREGR